MFIRPPFLGTAVLAAMLTTTTPAPAEELDASRMADERPPRWVSEPSVLHFQPSTRTDNDARPTPERGAPPTSLGIDVKIDGNGFRLGGRVSGSSGVSEAWINGLVRADGITLDARLKEPDGPARDFRLNLDLMPGWVGTAARLWRLLP